jgi:hypothetical protein
MATPLFSPAPSLMVVGPDGDLLAACTEAVAGLQVLRVVHAAAAVERMLVTRPLVVVLDESLSKSDVEQVVECARDIRAEVVVATKERGPTLAQRLRSAALAAEQRREIAAR